MADRSDLMLDMPSSIGVLKGQMEIQIALNKKLIALNKTSLESIKELAETIARRARPHPDETDEDRARQLRHAQSLAQRIVEEVDRQREKQAADRLVRSLSAIYRSL
jgi:hypothetical protein